MSEYEGSVYEFLGDHGLAPGWIDDGLAETDERWVSACLIARVNRFGVPVTILMRGPHKALKVSEAVAHDYSVEEGAFYGNVFRAVDAPLLLNACRGRDEAVSESGELDLRDCSEPDPENPGLTLCGFTYAGDCADWAPPANAYTCVRDSRSYDDLSNRDYRVGFYEQCHDGPGLGHWQHAERYREVITVLVAP